METDILIVGSGCSGLYCALNLGRDKKITVISKEGLEDSDSYLAQGGICVLKDQSDYDSYFEDTLKAGHGENDRESVDIMIRSSRSVIRDLISYGVRFKRDEEGNLMFTREGAHTHNRILFHEDITGKEITSHLLDAVKKLDNVTLLDHTVMEDLIEKDNTCYGAVLRMKDGSLVKWKAGFTVLACGGIGGLFRHSTNFTHLTGDGVAVAIKHGVKLKNVNYIQVHPTTFYSERPEDRSFLMSESLRGEGAKLYGKDMKRFTNELLPRDVLTQEIYKQMKKDGTKFVWEDLRTIPRDVLMNHFPNIVQHCLEMGIDPTKECVPVVPAQHYYMGGIEVNHVSMTSMNQLYAVGETACNGVHGRNRLASNSLLESLVFAKRAADDIMSRYTSVKRDDDAFNEVDGKAYIDRSALQNTYEKAVTRAIEEEEKVNPVGIAIEKRYEAC